MKRFPFVQLISILVTCTFAGTAWAENWPRFRGPNGQGVSADKGFPVAWSEDDVAWRIELGGTGHSSPVIWDDKIFVTVANEESTRCTLIAVDAATGAILWKKDYPLQPLRMNALNSAAAATPAVDADGIYAIWYGADHTRVTATDHDGKAKWEKTFDPVSTMHGPGGSPMVYEDLVVFTLEQRNNRQDLQSFWYALDKHSGETRWQLQRDNSTHASNSTPCVHRSAKGEERLIFTSRAHGITAVDPATGAVAWEEASTFPARTVSSPVVTEDLIVATCGQGGSGVQLAAVRPPIGDTTGPQVAYLLTERFVPNVPTPIIADNRTYLFHDQGLVTCLDLRSGDVLWSTRPGGKFYGSPVLVEDRLYCINTSGQVIVLKAAAEYELLATNDLGEPSQATPAIANGRMILRTLSHLLCIAAESLK